MAEKLGTLFLHAALGPVHYAGQCIMQQRVKVGIAELAAESLHGALQRGIDSVAAAAGLPRRYVEDLLPMAEIAEVARRIAHNQRAAVEQWDIHTGHVGGLLEGVADLTIDNRPPDASLCLLRLSKKMQLDKQLAAPLRQLSEDLLTWNELIGSCRTFIDDGRSLESAYRQRRLVRIGLATAGALAVAVVVVWIVRVNLARSRIDQALALHDPCAAAGISASDLGKASGAQEVAVAEKRTACADREAEAARAAEAEKAAAEEAHRAEEEAAARLTACEALAEGLVTGTADAVSIPQADARFVARLAKGALEPEDVGSLTAFPCVETKAEQKLSEAYARAVFGATARWVGKVAPSKLAEDLIVAGKDAVPLRQRNIFGRHVEDMAKIGLQKGGELLGRVVILCRLKERLEVPLHQHCKAVRAIPGPP